MSTYEERTQHSQYRFGDDTTTITTPESLSVCLSPESDQPHYQDTVSFQIHAGDGTLAFEATASHFSSGNRAANLEKFIGIIQDKRAGSSGPQVVMGDINTEVKTAPDLQALSDETGMVIAIPSLKIRKLRGLQDQLHKRMDCKDDYDSMFVAAEPDLVSFSGLSGVAHQNFAWPHDPSRSFWKTFEPSDVAQAWTDPRILTDHGVLKCPLVIGQTISLGNAARANYEKYNIRNEARIDRRTYLRGQQIIETCVADAVIAFLADLPTSPTLTEQTRKSTLAAYQQYRHDTDARYQAAFAAWDDDDDLCSPTTPLGLALRELGAHSKRFVDIANALHWEDIERAERGREQLKAGLTEALITSLGVGANDPSRPLANRAAFVEDAFRQRCEAKIDAAWERIIKRQAAGDLYKLWFAELLQGQTTGGMPIPSTVIAQPTERYIEARKRELGLVGTVCVMVEALR